MSKEKRGHVVGHLRNPQKNKDGTVTFSVSGGGFRQNFLLPPNSPHDWQLRRNVGVRVLVRFIESEKRSSKIKQIIIQPTGDDIRKSWAWVAKGG